MPAQNPNLDNGEAAATVRMRRPGVVVLSISYDPGWTATVNGRPQPTRMVASALVAVDVPAGTGHVVFRYPRIRRLPAIARAERPHPRRRRAGVPAARKAAPRR